MTASTDPPPPPLPPPPSDPISASREIPGRRRPLSATLFAVFCVVSVIFLAVRDVFLPHVRDTEVWFGFEFEGPVAWWTAPLHWAVFAVGAWGFWSMRPWIWNAAAIYAFYIALSHVVWNLVSPLGGGWRSGAWQFAVFCVPVALILWARPSSAVRRPGRD